MEALFKYFSGLTVAFAALLCPITSVIVTALSFILVDFVTGVCASRAVARREARAWWFESRKAWRTVAKAGLVSVAIVMMWLIDVMLVDVVSLNLAKLFAGFICGVEMWSFLENATTISESPLFERLGRWVKRRIDKELDDE